MGHSCNGDDGAVGVDSGESDGGGENGDIIVPDHGRPSISGPIRSNKMYSWAQCTVQKRLLCSGDVPCVAQEEQGFGPSTLSTYPLPIYLGYWGLSLPATLDQGGRDPITPRRVSK